MRRMMKMKKKTIKKSSYLTAGAKQLNPRLDQVGVYMMFLSVRVDRVPSENGKIKSGIGNSSVFYSK